MTWEGVERLPWRDTKDNYGIGVTSLVREDDDGGHGQRDVNHDRGLEGGSSRK